MSRERKVNVYCFHCNRTGVKYVTEEYRDGSWQRVSSALSEGWSRYNGGYILCPKCEHDPKAWREINAHRKSEKKKKRLGGLIVFVGLAISVLMILMNYSLFPYAMIPSILAGIVCAFVVEGWFGGMGCISTLIAAGVVVYLFTR